jgi:hypothetical protein
MNTTKNDQMDRLEGDKIEIKLTSNTVESQLGPLGSLFYGNASARLLDFLCTRKEFDFSETDISRFAGVSIRTTFRELPKFEELGVVVNTRRVGRAKMYKLDPYSKISKSLQQLVYDISTKRNDNEMQKNDLQQNKFDKHRETIEIMGNNPT